MSLDIQEDTRLYGGLVLRIDTTTDSYDTETESMELFGPLIVAFPDNDGTSALVVQDDNGNVLFRADSAGNIGVLGMQAGSETSVVPSGNGRFVVYSSAGVIVFLINSVGDIHQKGAAFSQGSITYEEYSAGVGPSTPFWSSVGPFAEITLTSAHSMPPLQLLDSASNVVMKITEAGDLFYTGGLFFGDIV